MRGLLEGMVPLFLQDRFLHLTIFGSGDLRDGLDDPRVRLPVLRDEVLQRVVQMKRLGVEERHVGLLQLQIELDGGVEPHMLLQRCQEAHETQPHKGGEGFDRVTLGLDIERVVEARIVGLERHIHSRGNPGQGAACRSCGLRHRGVAVRGESARPVPYRGEDQTHVLLCERISGFRSQRGLDERDQTLGERLEIG